MVLIFPLSNPDHVKIRVFSNGRIAEWWRRSGQARSWTTVSTVIFYFQTCKLKSKMRTVEPGQIWYLGAFSGENT